MRWCCYFHRSGTLLVSFFFFFQAEDGIRDIGVTGVQTCALPICTVSISGVYGGMVDPMPMMQLFDKGVQLRMGQAHVKRWIDEIMPLVSDDADPLGTEDLASHKIGIDEVPDAYEKFQKKEDGAIKFVIQP